MMNRHQLLEEKMCKELDNLEEKYKSGAELAIEDLKKMDILYHALKSKATYDAMKEAEEYGYEGNMSGRRGRDSMGRYVSREAGPRMSYEYDRGYSGHYPPDYWEPRHW